MRRAARVIATGLLAITTTVGGASHGVAPAAGFPMLTGPTLPVRSTGSWLTDATGRVVVLHGLNQVYKVPPYEPSADGFGDDDAAFLAANGFNAVRLGVIWAAVEPQPGIYDDAYLASIAQTVQTLANHGIVSLLDSHQDLYNEMFQGEGAPAWAVKTIGLPNPALGFPVNYLLNPAEQYAWDAFWLNAQAPDGLGLQDHYARAWQHTAAYFVGNPNVFGYEILNEPFAGTLWPPCLNVLLGCPIQDVAVLTRFYNRVMPAIRAVDPTTTVFFEPNLFFNEGAPTGLGSVPGAPTGFAFHDYCAAIALLHTNTTCSFEDGVVFSRASGHAAVPQVPALLTEFGATNNLANLAEVMAHADQHRMGWLEWAYSGNDKTSAASSEQALVYDPSQPPVGANVNAAKLAVLAAPYPQVIAGTPTSWSFASGTFTLRYTTARPDGQGNFPAGAQTLVSVPPVEYPNGYHATVTGGQVVSPANAPVLVVANTGGGTVTVVVTP